MMILPLLRTEREVAVRVLRETLQSGAEIIGIDPISEVRSHGSEKQVRDACQEMRRRTREWASEAGRKVNDLFIAPVVGNLDLINSTHLYPRLGRLGEILHSVEEPRESADRASSVQLLDELHPKILRRCQANYASDQFDDAVFNALKAIEHEIRFRISGRLEDVGIQLVSKAMNPKEPLLVFSGVIAEQEAAHSLFRGAIGMFKNPLSHRFLDISDQVRAWETLTFASLLMRLLDDAKDQTTTDGNDSLN